MPPRDNEFLSANMQEKIAYLSSVDPDFKKASPQEQGEYIRHLTSQMQPATQPQPQSFGDKLAAGGSSEGAQKFDQAHPILGKPLRALDAAGGAVMGLPSFLYHSVADPTTPEEQKDFQGHTQIPGELTAERLLGARQTAGAMKDYGAGKVSPSAAMSVLPEALGQGMGTVAAGKMAEYGMGNAPRIPGVKPALAKVARVGSDIVDPDLTGILFPRLAHAQHVLGRVANKLEEKPNVDVYRDATMNKRNVPEYAGEEEEPVAHGSPIERDATLNKRNIPEFAGEAPPESPVTSPSRISEYGRPGGRMARPFLPVIASPEQLQAFQNQMAILKPEAQAAGMYSAARGATRAMPDYQMRIGRTLRQFGPPEDLMEETTPPVRRKVENE